MNALNAAIYTKLSSGTALAALLGGSLVYYQNAPDGAAYPYFVWSIQAGGPLNLTRSDMRDFIIFARAYGTTAAQAGSIDQEAAALLHKGTLAVSGYSNFWCAREMDVHQVETSPAGQHVYTAGALYRIRLDD